MQLFTRTLAAMIVAGAALAPAAIASDGDKPAGGKGGHHGRMAFEAVDTDKSGGITVAELKAAWANHPKRAEHADKLFGFVDANKDGKLDKTEWEARKGRRGHGGWKRDKGGKQDGDQN
jgi:hypothetical protein